MTTISFKSAGVSVRVQNLTGPTATRPTGIPAGVVGAAQRGPAFVPVTVPTTQDFNQVFGGPNDYIFNGPIAASEWLRNVNLLHIFVFLEQVMHLQEQQTEVTPVRL